jgi:hypothetical protein
MGLVAWIIVGVALVGADARAGGSVDYRGRFDRNNMAINGGKGASDSRNDQGNLAWGESYMLTAYVEMYRATKDPVYLRSLVDHFDRMLKNRDDVLGITDEFAGRPVAGWGSSTFSKGKWHVWLVHTGMILLPVAEFVRIVKEGGELQGEFGGKAEEFRARIEESIRDADGNWKAGPRRGEGFYLEPYLGSVQPLNQQNRFGSLLLEMSCATGNQLYRQRAEALALYFRNRLRRKTRDLYDWAYWPREHKDGPDSEDISHASINVDFAVRCAAEHVVFTQDDVARFARTWIQRVKRPDGSWADDVAGKGKGNQFMPYSIGLWMCLCRLLPDDLKAKLYADGERALGSKESCGGAELVGVARLLLYGGR